jgi:hypothetical protein
VHNLRLEVSVYNVDITNQFQQLLLKRRGGVNLLVEVTVNGEEENSQAFCPNYVQEFGLWSMLHTCIYLPPHHHTKFLYIHIMYKRSSYHSDCCVCVHRAAGQSSRKSKRGGEGGGTRLKRGRATHNDTRHNVHGPRGIKTDLKVRMTHQYESSERGKM